MSIEFNPGLTSPHDGVSVQVGNVTHIMAYEEFVCALAKNMGSLTLDIHHAATGAAGEAGELLDASKKHWVYGKELDVVNIVEELGDIEFYTAMMRQLIGVTRDEVIQRNALKLSKRYASLTYTDAAAIARADKAGESNAPV